MADACCPPADEPLDVPQDDASLAACCAKEQEEQARAAELRAVLSAHDPVNRALRRRQVCGRGVAAALAAVPAAHAEDMF